MGFSSENKTYKSDNTPSSISVMCDFEPALQNGFSLIFPGAVVTGCWFQRPTRPTLDSTHVGTKTSATNVLWYGFTMSIQTDRHLLSAQSALE